jgi:hypothetical protein
MDEINGGAADTNWFEVVSSEVRAWWETFQQSQPRVNAPDPMYDQWRWSILQGGGTVPIGSGPGVVEGAGLPSNGISGNVGLLLLGAVALFLFMKK